jgi:hypothetical protein
MTKIACWWFGCKPDPENAHDTEYGYIVPCCRCGAQDTTYADQVGDTRHNRAKEWAHYWLFRRWIPAKCKDCGRRSTCEECGDLPF